MKRSEKANRRTLPRSIDSGESLSGRSGKSSGKKGRNSRKFAAANGKNKRRGKASARGPQIRETEEARALLEDQLHSLYWWAFNACKMKGFIRAKGFDELQRSTAAGDAHTEQGDFADDHVSPEGQTF
jgi:hypothetical protein